MLDELGARWRTVLALLIAVATALLFSTETPMLPPASGQHEEAFCPPDLHDTPAISRQESGERSGSHRAAPALHGPGIGGLTFVALQALGAASFPALHTPIRTRSAGGIYPRGPPTLV